MYKEEMNPIGYGVGDQAVAESLAECLGNAVVLAFKAQGHHWNVMGPDFTQYHDFFGEIYEDVYGSIDPLAENLRKLGALAPYRLSEFASLTSIEDMECGCSPMSMCNDLFVANNMMIDCLKETFAAADAANQQGIADFIAGRIDMHQKWAWMLRAHLTPVDQVSF